MLQLMVVVIGVFMLGFLLGSMLTVGAAVDARGEPGAWEPVSNARARRMAERGSR
jgi:hypothetical protein